MLMSDACLLKSLDGVSAEQSKKTISIMLADDHPVVRFAVDSLLRVQPGIEIIGEAGSCADLMVLLEQKRPELLLLDLNLGDACGPEVLVKVREKYPDQKVIIYSSYRSEAIVIETLRIGIQGYLLKGSSLEKLHEAIRTVDQMKFYMDPALAFKVMGYMRHQSENTTSNWTTLTPREKSVIRLVASGKRNKEIADALYISQRTVRFHISSLFKKLKVSNRTQLSKLAVSEHMIGYH